MQLDIKHSCVFTKNLDAYNDPLIKIIVNQGGARCFDATQKVITKQGIKAISNIQIGEEVLSYNTKTGINEYKTVIDTFVTENTKPAYKITLANGETITATYDHKFYHEGGFFSLKHLLSLWKNNGKLEGNTELFEI